MYAIIDYAGRQLRVEQGEEVKFPLLAGEARATITMERVLLLSDNGAKHIGQPVVSGASIDATIVSHGRERKVIVFKFKRRKGYRKKAGHRPGCFGHGEAGCSPYRLRRGPTGPGRQSRIFPN